tara:strand:- start:166 stop:423 length:258 start_codon:yes stop_codon:yes gene_type:complete
MPLQALAGIVHVGAQILDPSKNGIEAAEVGAGVIGNDPGKGGFAHAGRPMKDQVADAISLDGTPKQATFRQDPALAFEFIEGSGA